MRGATILKFLLYSHKGWLVDYVVVEIYVSWVEERHDTGTPSVEKASSRRIFHLQALKKNPKEEGIPLL